MTKTIEDLFVYLVFLADLLILFLFFLYFNQTKKSKPLVFIAIYCAFNLITNLIIEFFPFDGLSILYSYFTLGEYLLFSFIIYLITNSKNFKKIIVIFSIAFAAFLVFYTHSTSVVRLDSVPIGIETILVLIYSFHYLYEQMNEISSTFIYSKHPFWIVTGIMIYLAGSFFIYVFAEQVDKEILKQYWFLTNVFYIIKNILFAIGILNFVNQIKNPSPQKLRPYLN